MTNTMDKERLMFDEANLEVLCYECHNRLHMERKYNTADKHRENTEMRAKENISYLDKQELNNLITI